MDLPDFHIPHAEKIEWMIETHGWALEAVVPDPATDPPTPASAYSIGMREAVDFPDIAVFGLAPAASNGLITLVADACRGGTQIPLGVELVGLLDNELRCVFAPIDPTTAAELFETAVSWFRGEVLDMVQLIYPDRNGFLPHEAGFDQRMRLAQPIVGQLES